MDGEDMTRSRAATVALLMILSTPAAMFVMARRALRSTSGLAAGKALPKARLQHVDGHWESTVDWTGFPLYLVLFHAGCAACQSEIRNVLQIKMSEPELGPLKIILISLDSAGEARRFASRSGISFPVFTDPDGEFNRRARMLVVPTVYLVDREGIVVRSRSGPMMQRSEVDLLHKLVK